MKKVLDSILLILISITFIVFVLSVIIKNSDELNTYGYRRGRDTLEILADGKYEMLHGGLESVLVIHHLDLSSNVLLDNIISYKFENNILFAVSAYGYAIINTENDICKIYKDTSKFGYPVNINGEINSLYEVVQDENVIYLKYFGDFLYEEQDKLIEIENLFYKEE